MQSRRTSRPIRGPESSSYVRFLRPDDHFCLTQNSAYTTWKSVILPEEQRAGSPQSHSTLAVLPALDNERSSWPASRQCNGPCLPWSRCGRELLCCGLERVIFADEEAYLCLHDAGEHQSKEEDKGERRPFALFLFLLLLLLLLPFTHPVGPRGCNTSELLIHRSTHRCSFPLS